jgi:photosystem II stability/assembly factor-like uncharacterized protein
MTSDGGRSWTRVGSDPPCNPQFVNHVDAWCTALRIGPRKKLTFSTALYRTTDGGRSWRQVWHSASLDGPGPIASSTGTVSFTSPELGFSSSAGGSLDRTDDGGSRSQRQLTLPAYNPIAVADPPAVIGDAHSEAFGAPAGNHNGLSAAFYRSNDAGEHWTQVDPPGRPNVDAIDVVTPRIWKLQVSGRQLLTTVNAGQTWTRVRANVALPDFRLSGPEFTTTLVGWDRSVNGSGADLLRTTDGGRRWTTVHVPLQ